MDQLSLPFQNNVNSYREEDFLALEENSAARNFLEKFFTQNDFASAQLQSLVIKGEKSSGKSHLIHIFAEKFAAKILNNEEVFSKNLADFFEENNFYILENLHEINDEEGLLRLVNSAREAGSFLLMTTRKLPKFRLKDLTSRLKNVIVVEIKNLGHEAVEHLLINRLSRKQVRPTRRFIKSVAENMERSYVAVDEVVDKF